MSLIPRHLTSAVMNKMEPNKVVVLYGPRQVGKTTMMKEILKSIPNESLLVSGEDRRVQAWLGSQSIDTLRQYIGRYRVLAIDEAQKVNQIGLNLKLIVDHIEGIRVLATGSSSFELANQVGEPLTGRKWQYVLYPIAQMEIGQMEARHQTEAMLPFRLIYGAYPEVLLKPDLEDKRQILNGIVDGALYKDLIELDDVKKSQKVIDILRLIAFQIGNEVSLHEIGTQVHLDLRTVEKYLDLLEKSFVVKRVYGFSRNLRKEITKSSRFFFLDNGIRNAIIQNFNPLEIRNDVGQLWENYCFIERLKYNSYSNRGGNVYFWRTYDQKEIDLVEERGGNLFGYEFKWGTALKQKAPKLWTTTYPDASFEVVNPNNYLSFIS